MRNVQKLIAAAAACLCLTSSAAHAREINVRVSTLGVYESKFEGCDARIVTPYISGLAMEELQNEINMSFVKRAAAVEEKYVSEILELSSGPFAERGFRTGYLMDYRVIEGDARFFTLDVFEMHTVASSSTKRFIKNFDKETGMPVTLASFFNEKANYVKIVSDAVRGEMRRANKKQIGSYWIAPKDDGGFSSINTDQYFYVSKNGNIVICFDKYEVAQGSSGCPEIELDMKELAPWFKAK